MSQLGCNYVSWVPGKFRIDPPEDEPGWWICSVCQRPRSVRVRLTEPTGVHRRCIRVTQPVAPKQSRGLGDTVAKVIHTATGGLVKPCGGCKGRQKRLNEMFPYRDSADEDGGASG